LARSPSWRPAARLAIVALAVVPAMALVGYEQKQKAKAVEPRPVRTVTAVKGGTGETVVLTGQINAENEASLSFRIGGRIIERFVSVGDRVEPDQVLAKLDPQNELNALRSAQAAVSAAEGRRVETSNAYDRQKTLLPQPRGSRTRHGLLHGKSGQTFSGNRP
jgi:multidrug efflux pump subunit AcrA (membrane-fusion protein)